MSYPISDKITVLSYMSTHTHTHTADVLHAHTCTHICDYAIM